ncbi:MAG: diguanylate cyclase domain-containing protein [Eggerthellaceae bacterium]
MQWDEESPVTGRTYRNYDSLVTWIDGRRVHLQQSVDITALISANTDELTGMLSRRAGKEQLALSMARASQSEEPLSIALYDINRLKDVNDAHGHAEGDVLIRSIAQTVRREYRDGDYGFRLSGDEFVCVFCCDAAEAHKKMERARAALAALSPRTDPPYDAGFCYGIAELDPQAPLELYELLARADQRMYAEKQRYHIDRSLEALGRSEPQRADADPGEFLYDRDRLYDALVESTDDYLYVCNMKTGVFRYPRAMVEEFAAFGSGGERRGRGDEVHRRPGVPRVQPGDRRRRTTRHWVVPRAEPQRWVRLRCRGRLILMRREAPLFAGFITNLGKKSKVDPLTGLFNKFEFGRPAPSHRRSPGGPSACWVGIDDLRHINDRYDRRSATGHPVRGAPHQSAAPESAFVYRLDGDEFAIVARGDRDALRSTHAALSAGLDRQHEHEGRKFYCTLGRMRLLSSRCVHLRRLGDARTTRSSSRGARQALCELRAPSWPSARAPAQQLLRVGIRTRLRRLQPVHQPQVDAQTGRIVELRRWRAGAATRTATCPL